MSLRLHWCGWKPKGIKVCIVVHMHGERVSRETAAAAERLLAVVRARQRASERGGCWGRARGHGRCLRWAAAEHRSGTAPRAQAHQGLNSLFIYSDAPHTNVSRNILPFISLFACVCFSLSPTRLSANGNKCVRAVVFLLSRGCKSAN